MIALAPAPPAATAPLQELALELEHCEWLLADHMAAAVERYGAPALGVIDLPALGSGMLVPAQIRVSAVLYWASELEQAGLLPMIEALAEAAVRGTILLPLGNSATELARLWRTRERRFSEGERRALFDRIFSGTTAQGPGFSQFFRGLVQALVTVGRAARDQGISHLQARVAVQAQQVGALLSDAGTGIAAFAARDIVDQIREALRLLRDSDLERSLGGGSPWQLVSRHGPQLLGRQVYPQRHLALANAGLPIISWIAAEAPSIEAGVLPLGRAASVIHEAEAWSAAYGEV